MKKRIISIILTLAAMVSAICPMTGYADDIRVTLNGKEIYFDQPPIVKNDRTLVPVRAIFEAMGCTVLWNEQSQIIDVATNFGMMILGIGNHYIIYRNENEDRSIATDVPPQIINNRTYVPVRAIAECTGYNVDWDEETQTVVITGEMEGLTVPNADIPGYYQGTGIPDFEACFGIAPAKSGDGSYTYTGVSGEQVVEFIETYLASAGFLIDNENEIFGMFMFNLSNSKTQECVRVSYSKSDKTLFVTLSVG